MEAPLYPTVSPSRGTARAQSSRRRCSPCRSCRRSSRNAGLWERPPSWLKLAPTNKHETKCQCICNATCGCGSNASTTILYPFIAPGEVMLLCTQNLPFTDWNNLSKLVNYSTYFWIRVWPRRGLTGDTKDGRQIAHSRCTSQSSPSTGWHWPTPAVLLFPERYCTHHSWSRSAKRAQQRRSTLSKKKKRLWLNPVEQANI